MKAEHLVRIPGYQYNEYKIVLYPNEVVAEKIQNLKEFFYNEYNLAEAFQSKPVLTLVHFIQLEITEDRIMQRLNSFANGYQPVSVAVNGFGSLPTHTIFINIESKQTIQNLVKALRSMQLVMTPDNENKPHFLRDPHIILAGKLLPWQFEKGWLYYSHQQFTTRFEAGEITLLKRPFLELANKKEEIHSYKKVRTFKFKIRPVSTIQGKFFG